MIAPLLLMRWLISFFNIEYSLEDRTLRLSLVKFKFGAQDDETKLEKGGVYASTNGTESRSV